LLFYNYNEFLFIWKTFKIGQDLEGLQEIQINNMNAVTGFVNTALNKQNYIARLIAIQYSADQAYHFLILTPQSKYQALSDGLQRLSYSFDKISENEASQIKGRRLKIITVQNNDTIQSLARNMAFDDFKVERFSAFNGLTQGQPLRRGQVLKLIVME